MPDTPVKRGRGRPKGSTNATRAPATPTGPASGVAKRGRGRPAVSVNKVPKKAAAPKVPGRGRGRPKKDAGAEAVVKTPKSAGKAKKAAGAAPKGLTASGKKRGRPSKAAVAKAKEEDEEDSKAPVTEGDEPVPVVDDDEDVESIEDPPVDDEPEVGGSKWQKVASIFG